jgi:hypothetical protein
VSDLKRGAKLQMLRCNGQKNQEFEFMSNGRLRNQATNLCIDIRAPCKDHFRTPCERVSVTQIKHKAKLQLYTCHRDRGVLSNSYGNQKWNLHRSFLKNKDSGLCLTPLVHPKTRELEDMAEIEAQTCSEDTSEQLFDFLEFRQSAGESIFAKKFNMISDGGFLATPGRLLPQKNILVISALGMALFAAVGLARLARSRPMGEASEARGFLDL